MLGKMSDVGPQLALQNSELDRLRSQASQAPDKALAGAAQQFEALFLNTLLKSMREASTGDGLFDSEQTKLYTSMLDQQFAQTLSKRGVGLADMMIKQLTLQMGATVGASAVTGATPAASAVSPAASSAADEQPAQHPIAQALRGCGVAAATTAPGQPHATRGAQPNTTAPASPREFVERLAPHARQVAADLGIPEKFLLGHAALETGWGRREPRFADGSSSYNLFGIKADRSWGGPVVEVTTTEYIDGRREVVKDKFRAYASYEEALRDYADFLRTNPRYADVFAGEHDAISFARSLQQAGYATDPRYAEKLASVINGRSMRSALA